MWSWAEVGDGGQGIESTGLDQTQLTSKHTELTGNFRPGLDFHLHGYEYSYEKSEASFEL